MSIESFACTPSTAGQYIEKCIKTGLVPFIQSSPGIGKSSIVRAIADKYKLKLIDLRLSMCAPEDLNGLPRFKDNKAQFVPFDIFPLEDTPLPECKEGWLLFLDEFNSAPRSIQAAAYKLVLDRCVGNYPLHKNVALVAAGNLTTDGAITNNLSTAMQSRLIHLTMEASVKDWTQQVAIPQNYDERVIAFIQYSPGSLMKFDPEKQIESPHPFSCPRTWEFVNKLIQGEDDLENMIPVLRGTIDANDAVTFVQFSKVFKEIPSIQDVLKNPKKKPPEETSTQWAVLIHLANHVDSKNFAKIMEYVDGFSMPMKIVFLKFLYAKDNNFGVHPVYIQQAKDLGKYLQ